MSDKRLKTETLTRKPLKSEKKREAEEKLGAVQLAGDERKTPQSEAREGNVEKKIRSIASR